MCCASCASSNRAEFIAEINIHFSGLKNIGEPSVLLFPKLLVCLDCGFSAFTTPKTGLAILTVGRMQEKCQIGKATSYPAPE